jgi:hypothetical protein
MIKITEHKALWKSRIESCTIFACVSVLVDARQERDVLNQYFPVMRPRSVNVRFRKRRTFATGPDYDRYAAEMVIRMTYTSFAFPQTAVI